MEWVLVFDDLDKAMQSFPMNENKLVRINNQRICLSRLHDGFFAISDDCPHQAASMSLGNCKSNGIIECPWHHFLFDVRTGKNIGDTESNIETYEVKIENNQLFIAV